MKQSIVIILICILFFCCRSITENKDEFSELTDNDYQTVASHLLF
jgi:hypothetical protein